MKWNLFRIADTAAVKRPDEVPDAGVCAAGIIYRRDLTFKSSTPSNHALSRQNIR
jgi:hypothetical protein